MRLSPTLLGLLLVALPASAQGTGAAHLQVGVGLLPGTGGFAAYSAPRLSVFAQEGAVYADYTPRVVGGSGRLLAAVGVGGALRTLRVAALVGSLEPGPLDLDLGLRLGPSFYYAFFERTAEEEARSFRVMADVFVRARFVFPGSDRVVFVELGGQAPTVRGGLSLGL